MKLDNNLYSLDMQVIILRIVVQNNNTNFDLPSLVKMLISVVKYLNYICVGVWRKI